MDVELREDHILAGGLDNDRIREEVVAEDVVLGEVARDPLVELVDPRVVLGAD